MRRFRVGGLTFFQVGQFSCSWCFTQRREPFWTWGRITALTTAEFTVAGAFFTDMIRYLV